MACALALAFVGGTTLHSAENGRKEGHATVKAVHGTVDYQINDGQWMSVKPFMTLAAGAIIRTGPESYADVSVNGQSSAVRIDAESKLEIASMFYVGSQREGDKETLLDLKTGSILGNVKKITANSRYEIKTPHGVAGIRGTDFQVTVVLRPDGNYQVTFTSVTGQVIVSAVVAGATVVRILNTGESWTPGDGDVHPTPDQEKALWTAVLVDLKNNVIGSGPTVGPGGGGGNNPPPPPQPPPNPGNSTEPNGNTSGGSSGNTPTPPPQS